eukprot:gene31969-36092_t
MAAKNAELEKMNKLPSFGAANAASLQTYEAYITNIVGVAKACFEKYQQQKELNQKSRFQISDDSLRVQILQDAEVFKVKGGFWKALRVSHKALTDAHLSEDQEKSLRVFLIDNLINLGAEEHDDEHNEGLPDENLSPIALLKREREAEALASTEREAEESKIAFVDPKNAVSRTVSRDEDEDEGKDVNEGETAVPDSEGYVTGSESEWKASSSKVTSSTSKTTSSGAKAVTSKNKKKSLEGVLTAEEAKKITASNKHARREQAGTAAMHSENQT